MMPENAAANSAPEPTFPNRRGTPPAGFDRWIRLMLMAASVVTVAVALWLLSVSALVLPARDPAHVPLWLTVAFALLGYSALCWAHLLSGPGRALLRRTVLAASCAAVAAGIYGISAMIGRSATGGHFEGYIVLMGLIVGLHGLLAALHALRAEAAAPSAPSIRRTMHY
jgi:hypothetical protein